MGGNKKLRVGIAGYGVVGKRRHQFIDANPHLQVTAVSDRTFTERGALPSGVRFYPQFSDLLRSEELDVLFVCLTNDVAAEATMAGLERGLHVFCEKPPGRTPQDVRDVRALEATRHRLKLKYGFNHRYHDSVRAALDLVNGGELGTIINLRGVYGKSVMVTYDSDWRSKRAIAGGGILLDQGIHMVDLMRLFAGEFPEIHSFVRNSFWNYDVEDNAYALMRSDRNIIAFLHSTATEWRHRFNLEITLTKGAVILSGILSGTKSYGQETLKVVYRGENDGGNPREVMTSYIQDNSWRDEIDEFADCIVHDRPVLAGSSLDALKTMELVYGIYSADKEWADKFLEHRR